MFPTGSYSALGFVIAPQGEVDRQAAHSPSASAPCSFHGGPRHQEVGEEPPSMYLVGFNINNLVAGWIILSVLSYFFLSYPKKEQELQCWKSLGEGVPSEGKASFSHDSHFGTGRWCDVGILAPTSCRHQDLGAPTWHSASLLLCFWAAKMPQNLKHC